MTLRKRKQVQKFKEIFCSPQENDQGYIKILDAINDGILVADQQGMVWYINDEYTRITGVSREQILGKLLTDVRPGAMLPQVIQTGQALSGVYRREGELEYVVDMAPIIVAGNIVGGVSVVKDITEVQKLSEQVKKYHKNTVRLKTMVERMYRAKYTFRDIVGNSSEMTKTVSIAVRVAHGDADVLISGESGTGKEVFAQAIHNASSRSVGPFVAINCAAIAPSLIESELFGYEEGAFTGAKKGGSLGVFEIANTGTIFLDEIAELSLEVQAKLLRVLQERTVRRIGEANEIPIDIRVIAATNRDLLTMVRENQFRNDLYYRLNVLTIQLPPLRERGRDVLLLANKFIEVQSRRLNMDFHIHEDVLSKLLCYQWPGNVRELRNVIEYAVNMCDNTDITSLHLPEWLKVEDQIPAVSGSLAQMVHTFEKKTIRQMIEYYGSSVDSKKKIAKDLGISLATLYNKLE